MSWFLRSNKNINDNKQIEMPDGLWTKCPKCSELIFKNQLEENLFCCTKCDHHFRVGSVEYIKLIFDEGSFTETETNVVSADPLEFVDSKKYSDRIVTMNKKTGLNDALTTGHGTLNGKEVSLGCMNFNYIGGSMGA
ncbi:MAG: acetyl-CoA carboxylase carboxyl transferase subunit beta, partial [Chlorobi bacterium]|nr:acetyl-CoA carboxylase carboxyl transferase subunit beta [Chlorobiota bacterium]